MIYTRRWEMLILLVHRADIHPDIAQPRLKPKYLVLCVYTVIDSADAFIQSDL